MQRTDLDIESSNQPESGTACSGVSPSALAQAGAPEGIDRRRRLHGGWDDGPGWLCSEGQHRRAARRRARAFRDQRLERKAWTAIENRNGIKVG